MAAVEEPRICEHGGSGMLFPLTEAEHDWPNTVRAVMYLAALLYLFLGVNIVADKFVASIEVVTSQKKRVRQKSTGRIVTVAVWNGTIANLTLMALGSSAPEILLSCIEAVTGNFYSGDLGPGVIVGSAAFNLFMIISVCIFSIPSPETRIIKEHDVFVVTAVFSMIAYFWLVLICSVISPDVIEVWEALVTLLMMPVLLILSYLADIGYFTNGRRPATIKFHQQPIRLEDDLAAPVSTLGHIGREEFRLYGAPANRMPDLEPRNPMGILAFPATTWELVAGFEERDVYVPVLRMDGLEGTVACRYHTEGRSAVPGYDFVASEGVLEFGPNEDRAFVPLRLLPKRLGEHSDQFQIVLDGAEGGASFDAEGDGGEHKSVLTITIRNENEDLTRFSAAMRCCVWLDGLLNMDHLRFALATWKEDIKASVTQIKDDDDDEDGDADEDDPPSGMDYFMHAISLPWKLPFAIMMPPPAVAGGWPCFIMSLVFIGGLTCWVIDFAELFGCVANVKNEITAITLVALGTSMPDLFASKTAAVQDEYADASIVNVTGSNSVNVFLGIGVPWAISAIYWSAMGATAEWKVKYADYLNEWPQGAFIVKSGDLAFSVIVFGIGAAVALSLIHLRRTKLGGELGGNYMPKVMSSLLMCLLWVFYIALSIWKIGAGEVSFGQQLFAIFIAVCVLENVMLVLCAIAYSCGSKKEKGKAHNGHSHGDFEDLEEVSQDPSERTAERLPVIRPMPPPPPRDVPYQGHGGLRQAAVGGRSAPLSAYHPAGTRASPPPPGAHGPTVYGSPSRAAAGERPMSFTNAAMVCLAAKRFKSQAFGRDYGSVRDTPLLQDRWGHDVDGLPREHSFQSLDEVSTSSTTTMESRHGPPPGRSVAGRVVDYVGSHAVDWAALGAAGLAAAQVVDMQSGGTLLGTGL